MSDNDAPLGWDGIVFAGFLMAASAFEGVRLLLGHTEDLKRSDTITYIVLGLFF